MSPLLAVWRQLTVVQRTIAVGLPAGLLAVAVTAVALSLTEAPKPLAAVAPTPATAVVKPPPLPPDPTLAPDASPAPTPTATPPSVDELLGNDGRLTVLLLGSDYRPAHPGNRTDAIMVVSVDPTTGVAAGFSIPRDTTRFPLVGGGRYEPKVNGLYAYLHSRTGNGGLAMRQAVARAFEIEVDGYVFVGFSGVKQLVGAVGGVDITLDEPYYDAHYWVNRTTQGWGLPAGKSHLGPDDALIFARSRKGDSDFGRARRQQLLVLAALDKARSRRLDKLPKLLAIAAKTVRTDLPLARAGDLFSIVASTDIAAAKRTVFGPTKYATGIAGGAFELKLAECRAWVRANFPPVRTAPAASPAAPAALREP